MRAPTHTFFTISPATGRKPTRSKLKEPQTNGKQRLPSASGKPKSANHTDAHKVTSARCTTTTTNTKTLADTRRRAASETKPQTTKQRRAIKRPIGAKSKGKHCCMRSDRDRRLEPSSHKRHRAQHVSHRTSRAGPQRAHPTHNIHVHYTREAPGRGGDRNTTMLGNLRRTTPNCHTRHTSCKEPEAPHQQ